MLGGVVLRRLAGDEAETAGGTCAIPGRRLQQGLGVAVLGVGKDGLRGPLLHNPTRVEDQHPVAHAGDDTQVVADEQRRGATCRGQAPDQLQHLCLDRHVKRRGGLVGDEQPRAHGDRDCGHDPLPHTTRELVRIGVDPRLGVGDPDFGEQLEHLGLDRRVATMGLEDLLDLLADLEHGIECTQGVLVDDPDVLAPQPPTHPLRRGDQVVAEVSGRPGGGQLALVEQAQHAESRGCLAAAGLTDDAHGVPRRHVDAEVGHDWEPGLPLDDGEVPYREKWLSGRGQGEAVGPVLRACCWPHRLLARIVRL